MGSKIKQTPSLSPKLIIFIGNWAIFIPKGYQNNQPDTLKYKNKNSSLEFQYRRIRTG
jgi:hypothetical protein